MIGISDDSKALRVFCMYVFFVVNVPRQYLVLSLETSFGSFHLSFLLVEHVSSLKFDLGNVMETAVRE